MNIYYLATPYTAYPHGKAEAFRMAADQTAFLFQNNIWTFCPIAHSHPLAIARGLEDSAQHWEDYNATMLARCDGIIIVRALGWEKSEGIQIERILADNFGLRIFFMDLDTLPENFPH